MTLHLHRAERADTLVAALADVLREPLADPFALELVSVPTPGVERWISQRLSHTLGAGTGADGVCAGVEFPSPHRLVRQALSGTSAHVEDDPWSPSRAVWPLLQAIDEARRAPWAELLWSYLGEHDPTAGDARRSRRWSTARHLATLYARYATGRPAMLTAWAGGADTGPDGKPLPRDRAWQAELWRRLWAVIGGADPVSRLRSATAELRRDASAAGGLPDRLSVFGLTRLDPQHLEVLLALALHREVHLWLPHPSPDLWAAVEQVPLPPPGAAPLPRAEDPTQPLVRHPLLAYLGRDARELQLRLRTALAADDAPPETDTHHRPDPDHVVDRPPPTLLERLQTDLAADRTTEPGARPVLADDDRSVRVHACHGPARQVEVLREVLVGLLADDESLQPRDIVVMCPDIETYAPLVAAAFGLDTDEHAAEHPGHRLRVRLADRSLRQLNPVLAVVGRVVELAASRMTVSALLDLCAAPPVAERFRFSTDDLERLHELVPQAGVRWGLDAAHRSRFGMAGFGQNTWAAGLDRLLLGVTMDETDARYIGTVLPMDDVDSGDVELVGRLAEYLARVRRLAEACDAPRSLPGWVALCREMVDLLTAVRPADRWQHVHAYAELARLTEQAGPTAGSEFSLAEVSALLADAFRGRASRANFRTGTLTVCTLLPMRAVPHRVVCLLGVDDGVFPRQPAADGDDLTVDDERVGDPDPRSEDRQLLLDAVLAAEDALVVLYTGMDPRTGDELPPAVPVAALLDALDQTARTSDGTRVRERVTVRHRLQPFDPDNFVRGGRIGGPDGFSFDRAARRGVEVARRTPAEPPDPYAGLELPPLADDRTVELAELARFFAHPAKALLRSRAGLVLGQPDEPPPEQIPVELTGLERWAVGDRLLRDHLGGAALDTLTAAEWRRGTVPPRAFGQRALADVGADVAGVADAAAGLLEGPAERADLVLDLGPVRLTGSVPGLHGSTVVKVLYSRLSAKHRLQAWVELLALTVARPEQPWRHVTVGRGGRFALGPVEPGFARTVLSDLVELQGSGLCALLPFSPKPSYAYALARSRRPDWEQDRRAVQSGWSDDCDEVWRRFFPDATLEQLMAEPSSAAEARGSLAEATRFGTLARRVFHPLLICTEG